MVIDATISIGNILTLLVMIIGGVLFLAKFRTDIAVIDTKQAARMDQFAKELQALREEMAKLATAVDKISGILIELAKQQIRIDSFEERLRALEAVAHVRGVKEPAKRRRV